VGRTQVKITVRGRLSPRFARAVGGLELEPGGDGTTLRGEVVDAAALYGLIDRVRELGLELTALATEPVSVDDELAVD
jgi:hypothetical protein